MANHKIYTRVYSPNSAGELVSGRGATGQPLSNRALVEEFDKHDKKWNRTPTALVSASDRIVETLWRAFDKYYENGEAAADIWIAFIEVPSDSPSAVKSGNGNKPATQAQIHSARKLAEMCGRFGDARKFTHEVVFEWAIPEPYVLHTVSLQTLLERGLEECYFLHSSTGEAQYYIKGTFQLLSPWEMGATLGVFAQKFGAAAPVDWIARQLFLDCVQGTATLGGCVHWFRDESGNPDVTDQFSCDLEDGLETALCEWWLADPEFSAECDEFWEWESVMEDAMAWELVDFWEAWHDVDCDWRTIELSWKEKALYDVARRQLAVKHEAIRADIAKQAVKIGL